MTYRKIVFSTEIFQLFKPGQKYLPPCQTRGLGTSLDLISVYSLCQFAKDAITKYHRLGSLNNSNLLSQNYGG
jgi:hypothetical protein